MMVDICGDQRDFGGKVVVFTGDFQQIPPVVLKGSRPEIVAASCKTSPIFLKAKVLLLTQPMRTASDPDWQSFIKSLTVPSPSQVSFPIAFPQAIVVHTSQDDALRWLFSQDMAGDVCANKKAMLCFTNARVDLHNDRMLTSHRQEQVHTLISYDTVLESYDERQADMVTDDLLHAQYGLGVPPHQLRLSVGAICTCLRNLDPEAALMNGSKLEIITLGRRVVHVKNLRNNKVHLIPKIKFHFYIDGTQVRMQRRQFPLRLCYAMTVNKS